MSENKENKSTDMEKIIKYICFNKLSCLCGADEHLGSSINLQGLVKCLELTKDIPGDFVETGVWRGGASMLAQAFFMKNKINKKVYAADSFEGLPRPQVEKYPVDAGDIHFKLPSLSVSREEVEENFRQINLLNENVIFVEGWFEDTLPILRESLDKISLLRLDGDMYDATWNSLVNLYDKLSIGGIIIIDDYSTHFRCKKAVLDFREKYEITEEIKDPEEPDDYFGLGSTSTGRSSGGVAWWIKEK